MVCGVIGVGGLWVVVGVGGLCGGRSGWSVGW